MHELSIAMSMVEMAAEEATRRGGAQVCAIHLKLGPLSGVVREALLFSYDVACEGTPLEGSRLVIEDVPVVFCPDCSEEQRAQALSVRQRGSATDAQHVAVEFMRPVTVGRKALPATCLTNDMAMPTSSIHPIQETHVALYHIMWDMVHTFLQHKSLVGEE